ncbi:MAG: stage II sporulation protein R [Veillonellaceae bacterium]|nr:stage II sporulation protein R [Veillonellaceae bacterium]
MRRKIFKGLAISIVVFFIVSGWMLLAYNLDTELPIAHSQHNMIRLHVIANSDSAEDQLVKLKVRDAVVSYLAPYLKDVSDAYLARQIISDRHDELIDVARRVLAANGVNYPVKIEVGIFDFPVKSYGELTLPAGKYEAARVLLGKAEGENWWCILFPPLCFIDMTNAAAIPKGASKDQEKSPASIEFRWKIAEMWSAKS